MLATERDTREGVELVAAIREAVGPDVEIYVDAHGRFSPAAARTLIPALAELGVGFLEEPVAPDDYEGMRSLRRDSPIPIAAGERCVSSHDFKHLIEGECADILQPDISWAGGIFEVERIAAWGELHQMVISVHNANSPLATATGLHLGASIPNFIRQEMFEDFDEPWVKEAFVGVSEVEDGHLPVPSGPGIGVEPIEDAFTLHPYRPVFLNLSAENWEDFDAVLD